MREKSREIIQGGASKLNKPKWQRAVAISGIRKGAQHWIELGEPFTTAGIGISDELQSPPEPHLWTNVIFRGERLSARLCMIELLARDENDFAEDVPMISFEEFLAQSPKVFH